MEKSYVLCNGVRINFFEMFMRKNYRQTDKLEFVSHKQRNRASSFELHRPFPQARLLQYFVN